MCFAWRIEETHGAVTSALIAINWNLNYQRIGRRWTFSLLVRHCCKLSLSWLSEIKIWQQLFMLYLLFFLKDCIYPLIEKYSGERGNLSHFLWGMYTWKLISKEFFFFVLRSWCIRYLSSQRFQIFHTHILIKPSYLPDLYAIFMNNQWGVDSCYRNKLLVQMSVIKNFQGWCIKFSRHLQNFFFLLQSIF